jgi:L-lactate dehydrogenase complex protein LldG
MSARERILARVRAAQAADTQRDNIEQPIYPFPPVGPELVTHFSQSAARLGSEVLRVSGPSAVPAAVARYLATYKLPARAVCWPELAALPWTTQGVAIEVRAARGDDVVGITGAFCAIAETGTLMLLSGAHTPATVSLLPETHIAVVSISALVATMEEAWGRQRAHSSGLPRAVNFISGPSRTADVEQTVTLGAHGPRSVLIVLVEG